MTTATLPSSSPVSFPAKWYSTQDWLAYRLIQADRPADAERVANDALEINGMFGGAQFVTEIDLRVLLAVAVTRQGRPMEAVSILEAADGLLSTALKSASPPLPKQDLLFLRARAIAEGGANLLRVDYLLAAEVFLRDAIDIYASAANPPNADYASTLWNLGETVALLGRTTSANFLFDQGRAYALAAGDTLLVDKIDTSIIRHSSGNKPTRISRFITRLANNALKADQYTIAYQRYGLGASTCLMSGAPSDATTLFERARALENQFPAQISVRNRLDIRFGFAEAHVSLGRTRAAIRKLAEGADLWLRYAEQLAPQDLDQATRRYHDHFRFLARLLLDDGRPDEALLAFELCRATAFLAQSSPGFVSSLLAASPISPNGRNFDISILRRPWQTWAPTDVAVAIALIPPELVAFIVDARGCTVATVALEADQWKYIRQQVILNGQGWLCGSSRQGIPAEVWELARLVVGALGSRRVRVVAPHDFLHGVPWRAVFRECGVPWSQIPMSVEFAWMARCFPRFTPQAGAGICALGNGRAGKFDLCNESYLFANTFSPSGASIANATGCDLADALGSNDIVMVSCHGTRSGAGPSTTLKLELSDGTHDIRRLVPANVGARTVILSACHSGAYELGWGDRPVGGAPELLRRGVRSCIVARHEITVPFAEMFFTALGCHLATGATLDSAFTSALTAVENQGWDRWRDLSLLELLGNSN